jgi:hypothetical protein
VDGGRLRRLVHLLVRRARPPVPTACMRETEGLEITCTNVTSCQAGTACCTCHMSSLMETGLHIVQ